MGKDLTRYAASKSRNETFNNGEFFMMLLFTKRNHSSISCRVKKAGESITVKLFEHINACIHLINTEVMHFVNKRKIPLSLLTRSFGFLSMLKGNSNTTNNCDYSAKQLTERAVSKNTSAKNKHHSISRKINSAVNGCCHHLQPIAVPNAETQSIFSRLLCHKDLLLVIILRWLRFMQHVEVIGFIARLRIVIVAHRGSFLWWVVVMPMFLPERGGHGEDTTTRPGA
ncbi:hypothetical protein SMEM02_12300 [Serratia marcescens]|nr:hypothetical protein SMEM02_12300 [Serratia marcescens]